MNKLVANGKRMLFKAGFKLKKHSPEILICVGVVGTISSTVMACKATLKAKDVIDEAKIDICEIKEDMDSEFIPEEEKEASKKELAKVYVDTGVQLVKIYAPSVILGTLSLGTVFASNNILRTRNASLSAAYTTLDSVFKKYRNNVKETYGDEVDHNMRYGIREDKIEMTDENGKKKTQKVKHMSKDFDPEDLSLFMAKGTSVEWDDSEEYLMSSLTIKERVLDDMLKSRGYLFVNEVRHELGFDPVAYGQTMGWIFDTKNENLKNEFSLNINWDEPYVQMYYNNAWRRGVVINLEPDGDILSRAFK